MKDIYKRLDTLLERNNEEAYSLHSAVITAENIATSFTDTLARISREVKENPDAIDKNEIARLFQLAAEVKVLHRALEGMENSTKENKNELDMICMDVSRYLSEGKSN